MIDAWTWPAFVGVLFGVLAFAALIVPILVWESRSHGQIRFIRLIGAAMVSVYGVALIAYTLLPIPTQEWCSTHPVPGRNLTPFAFVGDLIEYHAQHGVRALLTSFVFLQVAFNVLLFIPWGALMRRFFGRGIVFSFLSGVALSAFIEATQTTGGFGLFPCRYRVGDVDDLILNSAGALIGAVAAPVVLFFLPDPDESARTRRCPRPVTPTRRLVGMVIDASLLIVLPSLCLTIWRVISSFVFSDETQTEGAWDRFIATAVVLAALLGFRRGRESLGQRAVWLRPTWPGGIGWGIVPRFLLGFGGWGVLVLLSELPGAGNLDRMVDFSGTGLAIACVVGVLVERSARGLSLWSSGGELIDSRSGSDRD